MRTLLRRLTLWALGLRADQLEALQQKLAQQTTPLSGTSILAGSITADKIAASTVASYHLAPHSVTLEHLTPEVRELLLPHPVPNNERLRPTGPVIQPLGSGRLAPRPAPTTANVGEGKKPESFVPDIAARDGNGGA